MEKGRYFSLKKLLLPKYVILYGYQIVCFDFMCEISYPWVFFKEQAQLTSSFASQKADSHRSKPVQWKLVYETRIQIIKQVPCLVGWYLAILSVLNVLL